MKDLKTNVPVHKLIAIVKENWEKHAKKYVEAHIIFKKRYIEVLENMKEQAERDDKFTTMIGLSEPKVHEEDYRRLVDMLEMSSDDTIELDEHSYDRIVNDQWDWKRNFDANTSIYLDHLR